MLTYMLTIVYDCRDRSFSRCSLQKWCRKWPLLVVSLVFSATGRLNCWISSKGRSKP